MISKQKFVGYIKKSTLYFIYAYTFITVVGYFQFNCASKAFIPFVTDNFLITIIILIPTCVFSVIWEDYKKTNLKLSTFIEEHRVLYGWITSFIAVGCLVLGKLYGYPFFLWLRSHGLA